MGAKVDVYRREFLVRVEDGDAVIDWDNGNAVVQEAMKLGLRPSGDAKRESVKDHPDGLHKVVTWVLPVESNSSDNRSYNDESEPKTAVRRPKKAAE